MNSAPVSAGEASRTWCLAGESTRGGAKRHMPNLHTARPHLQSHSLTAHLRPSGVATNAPAMPVGSSRGQWKLQYSTGTRRGGDVRMCILTNVHPAG